jgi:hypothetical protein
MRSATRWFVGVVVVGAVLLAIVTVTRRTPDAFSFNAPRSTPAVELRGGQVACQDPVDVPVGGAFDRVRLQIATFRRPGPELRLRVHAADGRVLATHTLAAGYRDRLDTAIPLGRRLDGRGYRICFENRGRSKLAIFGTGGNAVPASAVRVDGLEVPFDLALRFEREEHSLASVTGDVLRRATLFRSPRLSAVTYGALLVVLLLGAAVALGRALRAAERDDQD